MGNQNICTYYKKKERTYDLDILNLIDLLHTGCLIKGYVFPHIIQLFRILHNKEQNKFYTNIL